MLIGNWYYEYNQNIDPIAYYFYLHIRTRT